MTIHLSVSLDDDQKARFDAIAAAREEPLEKIVAEAITDYLEYDRAFRAAVEVGLEDVRAGRVYDFDEVMDELWSRHADGKQRSKV